MSDIEVFENLMEPLKSSMPEESWIFLLSRGKIFISQLPPQIDNPIKQLNYVLVNKVAEIMKQHPGMLCEDFRELPEVKAIWNAMDVIKPYIEKD